VASTSRAGVARRAGLGGERERSRQLLEGRDVVVVEALRAAGRPGRREPERVVAAMLVRPPEAVEERQPVRESGVPQLAKNREVEDGVLADEPPPHPRLPSDPSCV
jgi:hypothetical protein